MNAATKSQIANVFTSLSLILVVLQTLIMTPPFTPHQVYVWGAILTYATLIVTTWKQYLSPDVSNVGSRITIWIAIGATVAGLLDFYSVIPLSENASQWVKWSITLAVAIINVLSKQLFPSEAQKDNMSKLKLDK